MKKIATITFHWAKNYGAVLQTYALQRYLEKQGYNTEIINYLPLRTMILNFIAALKKWEVQFFKKIPKFKKFRKNELIISKKRYFNNRSLYKCSNDYEAVICGSDQIWNKSFTNHGEGKPTLSYFLNFVGKSSKRISYAASFGTTNISGEMEKLIKPELEEFSAVSVREESACEILNKIDICAKTVVDPTLLLKEEDYLELIKNKQCEETGVLTYVIHHNQKLSHSVNKYIVEKYNYLGLNNYVIKDCDIYEWLLRIKNSRIVVTNSFHGTVFSLIFHKPFISVAVPGSGMNDRLTTLLKTVGLADRFIYECDTETIDSVLHSSIDWESVDYKIEKSRQNSALFLAEALKK